MMDKKSLFHFEDYRLYLKSYLKQLPQSRGAMKSWAEHLGVHSTLVSQVMIQKRDFTEEQGIELSDFIGHNPIEKEYFLELLKLARAGSEKLRNFHKEKINRLKIQALQLSERILVDRKLTDHESAVFYSSWIYSAIRLCCSIDEGMTLQELESKLSIPRKTILEAIEFLRGSGFVEQAGVRYTIGTQYTHLAKKSPYLVRHHNNWRLRALQKADQMSDQELMYTAPFSISEKDFIILRESMVQVIEQFLKTVKASEGEIVACFNMDLFKVTND